MNLIDLLLLLLIGTSALAGWRVGLLARLASWVGVGAGLYLALRLSPAAIRSVNGLQPTTRVFLTAVIFIAFAGLGAGVGEVIGHQLRRALPFGGFRTADRAGGLVVGVLATLAGIWLLLPILAEVPGGVSRQVRGSEVAQTISEIAPAPPDAMRTLRGLVTRYGFPQVFADLRPAPDTGPPPADSGLPAEVVQRVAASTVQVSARGCGGVQEGSGFAAAPGLVVTNAHVVAGAGDVTVLRPDGRRLPAQVVRFDPDRDLALLRVSGLDQAPLPVGEADVGDVGAVFGHPRGQVQLEVSPARVTDEVEAQGFDIYGTSRTTRLVLFLASELAPGDSGAALVDAAGEVIGVAFAISPDRPDTAYALSDDELRRFLAQPVGGPVDTGPCIR